MTDLATGLTAINIPINVVFSGRFCLRLMTLRTEEFFNGVGPTFHGKFVSEF